MQQLKAFFRGAIRRLQAVRSRIAGWFVRGLLEPGGIDRSGDESSAKQSRPTVVVRWTYRCLLVVYLVKRWCQDCVTSGFVPSWDHIRVRSREVESNLLIKLVVWRDWPIGKPFQPYPAYASNNRLTDAEVVRMRSLAEVFLEQPLFSVVVPVFEAKEAWIDRLVTSLLEQVYERWELIFVDDGSRDARTWQALERHASRDSRIQAIRKEENCGVVAATTCAVEAANGSWLAFVDHDDELLPDALWEMARAIASDANVDVLYSDEELRLESGGGTYAHFKPGYSPQLLTAYNYICHLLVVRRERFDEVGGLRAGTDGAQDYDLILRLSERTNRFRHIARVLYRWNVVPESFSRSVDRRTGALKQVDSIDPVTQRIVQEHLERLGVPARAELAGHWIRPRFEPVDLGKATIIICTKDQPKRLLRCIRSIERETRYPNYEILIVDNGSEAVRSRRTIAQFEARHRVERIASGPDGFNFSRLNNLAAGMVDSEYVVFLNDDTHVTEGCWLSALIGTMQDRRVGAVGARLLYPDGRNQHAGLIVGAMGWGPWHALMGLPARTDEYGGYLTFPHNCSAVTGACLATRRSLFVEHGGFNESELAVSFNDVDFCLRLVRHGYLIAYAPQAELIHEEGASRGRCARPTEALSLKRAWDGYQDPWWNANYNRMTPHFALDARRRSRDVGVVTRPRVLRIGGKEPSWTREVLDRLAKMDKCEVTSVDAAEFGFGEIARWLEERDWDAVVLDGPEVWPAVDLCGTHGVSIIWSLPKRLMAGATPSWSGRRDLLRVIERLSDPYQVVYSDPFSVGWAAAGMPRTNQWLSARMPLVDESGPEHSTSELRKCLEVESGRVVLYGQVREGEIESAYFLVRLYRRLARRDRERSFLLLGVEGETSAGARQRLYREVKRTGSGVAVVPASAESLAIADVLVAHETVDPRPVWILEGLQRGLPMVATSLVERGDLMHRPATGRVAQPFCHREWAGAIGEILHDDAARREMGRQARAWLDCRQSPEDLLSDWYRLLEECSELNSGATGRKQVERQNLGSERGARSAVVSSVAMK